MAATRVLLLVTSLDMGTASLALARGGVTEDLPIIVRWHMQKHLLQQVEYGRTINMCIGMHVQSMLVR